jgi:hypothetical protein
LENIYKILAKLLSIRIQVHLLEVIRPNQTGFVAGRSILDNVFLARESMEWAKESNQRIVLLMPDFENAFHKINWGFLFEVLWILGFCDLWI